MNHQALRGLALIVTLLAAGTALATPQSTDAGRPDGTNLGGAAVPPTTPPASPPKDKGPKGMKKSGDPEGSDILSSDPDPTVARKIALEESKLERRKAKIARLRELATQQGNAERLRALDELERKLVAGHERKIARWQEKLGDERYRRIHGKVERRKAEKDKDKGKGKDRERDGSVRGGPDGKGPGDAGAEHGHGGKDDAGDGDRGKGPGAAPGKHDDKGQGKDQGAREPGAGSQRDTGRPDKGPGKSKKKGDKP